MSFGKDIPLAALRSTLSQTSDLLGLLRWNNKKRCKIPILDHSLWHSIDRICALSREMHEPITLQNADRLRATPEPFEVGFLLTGVFVGSMLVELVIRPSKERSEEVRESVIRVLPDPGVSYGVEVVSTPCSREIPSSSLRNSAYHILSVKIVFDEVGERKHLQRRYLSRD